MYREGLEVWEGEQSTSEVYVGHMIITYPLTGGSIDEGVGAELGLGFAVKPWEE